MRVYVQIQQKPPKRPYDEIHVTAIMVNDTTYCNSRTRTNNSLTFVGLSITALDK